MQRIRQKQEGHSDQDRQTGTESERNKSVERNAKARRMSRKEGETQSEVDDAKDGRTQELALTEALSTEQDVRGKPWEQRAVLNTPPPTFGDIALHSPGWPGSPDLPASDSQCPKISPFLPTSVSSVSSLRLALAQAGPSSLPYLWVPQSTLTQCP